MRKPMLRWLVAGILVTFGTASPLLAVNRFFISNQSVNLGSSGNLISIRGDVDQDTYGFSINLHYDASKIRVTAVQLGAVVGAIGPEYSQGTLSLPAEPGRVVHGIVFDTSGPSITKKLSPGANLELLRLVVDVVAAAEGSTGLDLVNVPGTPSRLNVMTNANGDSVSPAPTLVDGTLTLVDTSLDPPLIEPPLINNMGNAGKVFIIPGQNFNAPGLVVRVCSVVVAHTLMADNSLQVAAPACGATGWAPVQVCTDGGCDTEVNGFFYEGVEGTPFVRGNANDDATVDLSDAVAILHDLFLGTSAPAPCRDALDGNDDGLLDITDAVHILNFLFLGGLPIPPPYPDVGLDETLDELPGC